MSLLTTTTLQADGTILATWADGQSASFGAYWLRDNCRCAQCRHPGNGQKLYQIVDLPAQLAVGIARRTAAIGWRLIRSAAQRATPAKSSPCCGTGVLPPTCLWPVGRPCWLTQP